MNEHEHEQSGTDLDGGFSTDVMAGSPVDDGNAGNADAVDATNAGSDTRNDDGNDEDEEDDEG